MRGINPVRRPIIPKRTRIMGLVRAFAWISTMWSWAAAGPTRKPLLHRLLDLFGHGLRQLQSVTDDLIDLLAGRRGAGGACPALEKLNAAAYPHATRVAGEPVRIWTASFKASSGGASL